MATHDCTGKENSRTTTIRYARITPRILRYTSILNRARTRSLMFEFLSLFTLRRSTYCTLLSIVREFPPWTIMHFSEMENWRGVSRSSNNSVFIKFQRRAFAHRYVARWISFRYVSWEWQKTYLIIRVDKFIGRWCEKMRILLIVVIKL